MPPPTRDQTAARAGLPAATPQPAPAAHRQTTPPTIRSVVALYGAPPIDSGAGAELRPLTDAASVHLSETWAEGRRARRRTSSASGGDLALGQMTVGILRTGIRVLDGVTSRRWAPAYSE